MSIQGMAKEVKLFLAIYSLIYGILLFSCPLLVSVSKNSKIISLLLGTGFLLHSFMRIKGVYGNGPLYGGWKTFFAITGTLLFIISIWWGIPFIDKLAGDVIPFLLNLTNKMGASKARGSINMLTLFVYPGIPVLVLDIYYCIVISVQKKEEVHEPTIGEVLQSMEDGAAQKKEEVYEPTVGEASHSMEGGTVQKKKKVHEPTTGEEPSPIEGGTVQKKEEVHRPTMAEVLHATEDGTVPVSQTKPIISMPIIILLSAFLLLFVAVLLAALI